MNITLYVYQYNQKLTIYSGKFIILSKKRVNNLHTFPL